ncbi:riboflavin kinase [Apophysomyces sp. BC1034]|nr:riboflavin kinase [Apophysomyces sp. BC1015]KAG0180193.1 riboflavin kinase [Apophysomyces sp. BC1021]KAG0190749.1 riboflavin kinase [Apophysomyces sp. BC1034]
MNQNINPDRPLIVGPETPQTPYPYTISGTVVKGYGRGSKELGIPTANLSEEALEAMASDFETGVYYGWAQIGQSNSQVYPMVMSLGWNPYYNNEKRSAEVHIIHEFPEDFYGVAIRVIVLGYVRPEQNYPSLDALIRDIRTDVEAAKQSLKRKAYDDLRSHELFTTSQ